MSNVYENTAYCAKHGWVDLAEIIPGKMVPLCFLCNREAK